MIKDSLDLPHQGLVWQGIGICFKSLTISDLAVYNITHMECYIQYHMNNPYPPQPTYQPFGLGQMVESKVQMPPTCSIGKIWTESAIFDDKFDVQVLRPPIKLCSIIVSHTEDFIQGLGFKYKSLADGKMIETRHNLCNSALSKLLYKVTEREFKIDDNDYLMQIKGRSGNWLDRIEFVTYNGQNQNFGGKGGSPFDYQFPGYTFDIVSGGSREYIDFLNFAVAPLPDHFQQKVSNQVFSKAIQYPINYNPNNPSSYPIQRSHTLESQFSIMQLPGQPLPQPYQPNAPNFVQSQLYGSQNSGYQQQAYQQPYQNSVQQPVYQQANPYQQGPPQQLANAYQPPQQGPASKSNYDYPSE